MNRINIVKKQDLITGGYYKGRCRNAEIARWNGTVFIYLRTKFGLRFFEEIHAPEDETRYDVFLAQELIREDQVVDLIPLEIN